jgi:hypothetical protein
LKILEPQISLQEGSGTETVHAIVAGRQTEVTFKVKQKPDSSIGIVAGLTQVVAALFELRDGDVASTTRDLCDEVVAHGQLRTREEP